MTPTAQVMRKYVYGVERLYPVCRSDQLLASLTGKLTLDQKDLDTIRALGYEVVFVSEGGSIT